MNVNEDNNEIKICDDQVPASAMIKCLPLGQDRLGICGRASSDRELKSLHGHKAV